MPLLLESAQSFDYCLLKLTYHVTFTAMEKLRPHYPLQLVLAIAAQSTGIRFTVISYNGAAELGLEESDMHAVIKNLNRTVFYKSMTSYGDNTIWQDVYRPTYKSVQLYIKITLEETERVLVISFKRR